VYAIDADGHESMHISQLPVQDDLILRLVAGVQLVDQERNLLSATCD
jgi:hypothetical protein